jgi:hypothetical protein
LASRQLIECKLVELTTTEKPSNTINAQNNVQGQFSLSSIYATNVTVTNYAIHATDATATLNAAFSTVYDSSVSGFTITGSSLVNPTFVSLTESPIFVVEPSVGVNDETFALQISDKIVTLIDDDALRLIAKDKKVFYHTGALCDDVEHELRERGAKYTYKITTFSEPESTGHRMIVIEFMIENRSYSEILKMWNDITRRTFSKLPLDVRKKVALVMDR